MSNHLIALPRGYEILILRKWNVECGRKSSSLEHKGAYQYRVTVVTFFAMFHTGFPSFSIIINLSFFDTTSRLIHMSIRQLSSIPSITSIIVSKQDANEQQRSNLPSHLFRFSTWHCISRTLIFPYDASCHLIPRRKLARRMDPPADAVENQR